MKNILNTIYTLQGQSFKGKRLLMLLLLPLVIFGVYFLYKNNKASNIYAVDPLVITYNGSNPPNPMFVVSNMLPGDEVEKVFNVKNGGPHSVSVKMDGVKTDESKAFAGILDIEITEVVSATNFFSDKLQAFFDAQPINLGTFTSGSDKNFKVKVKFPVSAGDEYQLAQVKFNIIWTAENIKVTPTVSPTPTGVVIALPDECKALQGVITKVVEGTNGNDHINASNAPELILGKDGDDKIFGLGGDDCIVGGSGKDRIESGRGNDIVIAGDGDDQVNGGDDNDIIYGGSGEDELDGKANNDKIYGGDNDDEIDGGEGEDYIEGNLGNDDIKGGSGNDTIYGNVGNDEIDAGQGDDKVYGGTGNDDIDGGVSGVDQLFGEDGNDTIKGGNSNDILNGGPNTDILNGQSGTDTCTQGETNISCEI